MQEKSFKGYSSSILKNIISIQHESEKLDAKLTYRGIKRIDKQVRDMKEELDLLHNKIKRKRHKLTEGKTYN